MFHFIKKITVFSFMFVLVIIFMAKNIDKPYIDEFIDYENKRKTKRSYNLILGSSLAMWIDENDLGENWLKFSFGAQNIQNSTTFLSGIDHLNRIDTLLYIINPFDFPKSYINDRKGILPIRSAYFTHLKKESIFKNILNKNFSIEELQSSKDIYFQPTFRLIQKLVDWLTSSTSNKNIINVVDDKDYVPIYFYNVPTMPNFSFLKQFQKTTELKKVDEVIYVIPPKRKDYVEFLKNSMNNKKWQIILNYFSKNNMEVINLETLSNDMNGENNFYIDQVHPSGGNNNFKMKIQNIIKNRLKEK